MKNGTLLAIAIFAATIALVAAGTIWPTASAVAYAGGRGAGGSFAITSTPQSAVDDLGAKLKLRAVPAAYDSLANKAEFTEQEFERDLAGGALSLRTYATLESFDVQPMHQGDADAEMRMKMHWTSIVGTFEDTRDLKVVKTGDGWKVDWPIQHEPRVPPQVIPVNYLRWDVITRGAGDDWGRYLVTR